MKNMFTDSVKTLTIVAATALVACGGGSDSSAAASQGVVRGDVWVDIGSGSGQNGFDVIPEGTYKSSASSGIIKSIRIKKGNQVKAVLTDNDDVTAEADMKLGSCRFTNLSKPVAGQKAGASLEYKGCRLRLLTAGRTTNGKPMQVTALLVLDGSGPAGNGKYSDDGVQTEVVIPLPEATGRVPVKVNGVQTTAEAAVYREIGAGN